MSAPNVIWAWEVNPNRGQWEAQPSIVGEGVSYTRTDTIPSDPRVKALVEAAEWAWPILERYVRHPNDADDLAAFLAALKGAANE